MMTAAAARIAKAVNTSNHVVFRTEAGTGRGWYMLKPAGGWKLLGASEAEVLKDAREEAEYRAEWREQQAANARA